jgi:hypothetical protein
VTVTQGQSYDAPGPVDTPQTAQPKKKKKKK